MSPKTSDQCLTDDQLRDLLSERVTADQQVNVREHLNHCAACGERLEEILATFDETLPALAAMKSAEVQPWMRSILQSVSDRQNSIRPEDESSSATTETFNFPERSVNRLHCGRLDEFEIVYHVASGATGHLFRAHDTKLNRTVAIKVLRAELCVSIPSRQRFLQEANAIARIESDYIVAVYDVRERSDFPPYLVMEFIDGQSLQQELETEVRMEKPASVKLICEVLEGLTASHSRGVIHRDVKPGNILLQHQQQGPRAKLVDFGLARLDEQSFDLTSPGSIAGTPAYMAPEQVLDAHVANEQSDVYSVGAVLYELLTGEVPFRGSVRMVLHQVLHEEPRSLRSVDDEVPRDLQTICLKAMSKSPAKRYATAALLREDLQRWANGLPVLARPVGIIGRLLRWKARNPTIANLFLVIASLLVGLIVMWGRFTLDTTKLLGELEIRNRDLRDSNRLLKEATERSEADRTIAVERAESANRQATLAFRVLNRLTFGLQNALADRPKLQQQLLNASIEDLQQLSAELTADSPVSVTLTVAWLRMGEAARKTEDDEKAKYCFRQSQDTLDAMFADFRLRPEAQQCQIWLHLARGDFANQSGDTSSACDEFDAGTQLCRRLEAAAPDNIATLHSHALANIRILDLQCDRISSNDAASSRGLLTEAIELLGRCLSLDAGADDIRLDLAVARLKQARSIPSAELPTALEETFQAIDLLLKITADLNLRIKATEEAISAFMFLSLTSHEDSLPDFATRMQTAQGAIHSAIDQMETAGHVSSAKAAAWRQQMSKK